MKNDYYGAIKTGLNYIKHFGIKGMKWGIRRYEKYDGTLTEAGKKRYNVQQKALKYLKYSQKAHQESARKNQRQADEYSKNPDKIVSTNHYRVVGKNKYIESPVHARDLIERYQNDAKSDREMAKYYKDLINEYGNVKVSDISRKDWAYLKKWGKYYTKLYADRDREITKSKKRSYQHSKSLLERQLDASYGTDWRDRNYMREVWEIDDPYEWADGVLRKTKGRVVANP